MTGRPIHKAWRFTWKFVCAPILGLLFLSSMGLELYQIADVEYPAAVIVFGWGLALAPTVLLTKYFLREQGDGGAEIDAEA